MSQSDEIDHQKREKRRAALMSRIQSIQQKQCEKQKQEENDQICRKLESKQSKINLVKPSQNSSKQKVKSISKVVTTSKTPGSSLSSSCSIHTVIRPLSSKRPMNFNQDDYRSNEEISQTQLSARETQNLKSLIEFQHQLTQQQLLNIENEKINLSKYHYYNYLIANRSFKPWKSLIQKRNEKEFQCMKYFEFKLKKRLFIIWINQISKIKQQRIEMAKQRRNEEILKQKLEEQRCILQFYFKKWRFYQLKHLNVLHKICLRERKKLIRTAFKTWNNSYTNQKYLENQRLRARSSKNEMKKKFDI